MAEQSARELALLSLSACEKQGAWSDGFLKHALRDAGLEPRDAALCTQLCYGVLQHKLLLDWHIARVSSVPPDKLENKVLQSLRIGIYQMHFLTRVPHSAAVNESVKLARKYARNPRAAGLVNAVLRKISAEAETPVPSDPAIRYSHPKWLADTFTRLLGPEEAARLMQANHTPPPMTVQVNTCKTDAERLTEQLRSCAVTVTAHPWLRDCLLLSDTGNLERLPAFQNGAFYVQDAAARLAVLAAELAPGMRVLDACAAPGGKSFAAAIAMQNQGGILSCDIHPHKLTLIEAGARRLGLSAIRAELRSAKEFCPELEGAFDRVIADVPCSGLGIIRKKPDIRYKQPEPLENLPAVQSAILQNVARYVKPGGVLLYATCTLLPRENADVVQAFLAENRAFSAEGFTLPAPVGAQPSGMLTLWPHIHGTDGFFFAKLRRKTGRGS
ncbi:MAG: 16S rRNA (cytosine(967)-C(5))-methyltransferase RsmB [Oscillospiraceae bacterium]|nr:16S rRNA (cytosine(967)-C(5))-methyltransferase RsmB [Oscillospiraceae bacterium]